MKPIVILITLLCLLLTGCSSWLDGSYVYVETHPIETEEPAQVVAVSTYAGLLTTVQNMVAEGTEQGVISMGRYDQAEVEPDMAQAVEHILHRDPLGAYAVSEITYELGTSNGQNAVSLNIRYVHDRSEIRKIQHPADWEQAEKVITDALNRYDSNVVLYLEDYQELDFAQWVAVYVSANPDKMMEPPAVTVNLYPDSGNKRVVELKFAYENTRDVLKMMQEAVSRSFKSITSRAGQELETMDKYQKTYNLLMAVLPEDLQIATSITPAYSLLQHGVGDSKAFATVYSALCIQAGLDCYTVTGTKNGEPWYWNIVCYEGEYYHLDLLDSRAMGAFNLRLPQDMNGYVWDYNGYPPYTGLR